MSRSFFTGGERLATIVRAILLLVCGGLYFGGLLFFIYIAGRDFDYDSLIQGYLPWLGHLLCHLLWRGFWVLVVTAVGLWLPTAFVFGFLINHQDEEGFRSMLLWLGIESIVAVAAALIAMALILCR